MENSLIPRKLLFGNPEKIAPQISPDGKMLSYLAPVNNVLNLWLGEIGNDNFQPITNYTHKGIGSYFWARNNQYILYLQDINGDENWHLNSINITTLETRDYTPYANVQTKIAEHNKHYPDEVILSLNLRDPQLHDLYHLDLKTGFLKKIADNPGNFISWEIDTDLNLRAVMANNDHGSFDLLVKKDGQWEKLIEWDIEDSSNLNLENFSHDNKYLYLRDSRNHNASSLIKLDLETGESIVVFSDEEYDVNYIMANPDTQEIEIVSITKERNQVFTLSEDVKDDLENIANLNSGDYVIYDRDNADEKWLVAFTQDNKPSSYYLYNRVNKKGQFLFYNKPLLNNYLLSTMEPFSFTARDGLTIHGYISFPPDQDRKNLPMVLNVHGGPWMRDTWGFNADTQWITNRGYICLQINYRGSAGYGKNFINAADKEWSRKMHDDLIDGVNYIIEQGYADSQKVAIYGVSYGGYAALVGATFTPDFFCCAIDVVGPSNLITMINNIPPYWKMFLENLKKRVGDPQTEKEFLESCSPLFKVDKIKIPVMIAHGLHDPRVKVEESEQIVNVMKSKNIYCEYLLFHDEGHGISKPYNRERFYKQAEKFLSRYLGGLIENDTLESINKNTGIRNSIFD